MNSLDHEKYIRQTLEIAAQAVLDGDHPFGSLAVLDGEVVATAGNRARITQDFTQHAETLVVGEVTRRLSADELARSVLYTSTEPCVMCTGAILLSGISTVVYGCPGSRLAEIFGASDIIVPCRELFSRCTRKIEVIGPILEEEAAHQHEMHWPNI